MMGTRLTLLLLLSIVSGKTLAGDGFLPMVTEGKRWLSYSDTPVAHWDFTHYLSGDTVIAGEAYKKLYIKATVSRFVGDDGQMEEVTSTGPALWAFLQEQDGRVYMLRQGVKTLLYDFTLTAGDIAYETDRLTLCVTKVDTISVNGVNRKRLWIEATYKDYDYWSRTGFWVEGIGSNYGLEDSHDWDAIPMPAFSECYEGDMLVFTASDFHAPAWPDGTGASLSEKGVQPSLPVVSYDLQGRKVPNRQTHKGVYIVNGKKVVNS